MVYQHLSNGNYILPAPMVPEKNNVKIKSTMSQTMKVSILKLKNVQLPGVIFPVVGLNIAVPVGNPIWKHTN